MVGQTQANTSKANTSKHCLCLLVLEELAPGGDAALGVRMRPSDVNDEVVVADDVGEVAAGRELDIDVALSPLGARLPVVDGLVGMACLSVVEVTPGMSRSMR